MDKPLVAVATMLHARKQYSFGHWFEWARVQTWEPVEFIIRVHTGKYGDCHAVKNMRESIRQQALELGADVLFFMDCDTIPREDAVEQLLQVDGDIITGIYFSRMTGTHDRAVCWRHDDNEQNFLDLEAVSEINGAGMGCCLIHRRVFEIIDFKHPIPDDDYPYWDNAIRAGFRARSLNILRCLHYLTEKDSVYHEFGVELEQKPVESYTIRAVDGITINGKKYMGKVVADRDIIRTLRELDAPYASGIVKVARKVVGHFGPKDIIGQRVKHSGE